MPCESCNLNFTIFRRKKSCSDCRRYFCNNCLTTSKRNAHISLCDRCKIFAKRPLLRADLLQLKPKDLIFYLQSKHISTTGCVEKDELVKLVLNHVHQTDGTSSNTSSAPQSPHSDADPINSFDTLKQTCQNFFSSISENISDSFANLDNKTKSKNQQQQHEQQQQQYNSEHANVVDHISDQPRVSTREIPSYASFQTRNTATTSPTSNTQPAVANCIPRDHRSSISTSTTEPTSISNASLQSVVIERPNASPVARVNNSQSIQTDHTSPVNDEHFRNEIPTECDCSDDDDDDDELIANYSSERIELKSRSHTQENFAKVKECDITCSPSTSTQPNSSNINIGDGENSSQSSFEELGAIGGISDESKNATDTNSSNIEQWQLLDPQRATLPVIPTPVQNESPTTIITSPQEDVLSIEIQNILPNIVQQQSTTTTTTTQQKTKKVSRRRSDSYINNRRFNSSDDEAAEETATRDEISELRDRNNISCKRCGKSKTNIKRHVERMRRHLESSEMCEDDIKHELDEFLEYLEKRTKSIDCSDSETALSPLSGVSATRAFSTESNYPFDDNEGIHVYAATADYMPAAINSRFINLDHYDELKDLENLSVKQLKEVLMLHRVDYKGCCEKQELLDRVQRLWKNLKSAPSIDKLQTDELCKICMDAPIECVILECGHMATCTNCGKVLSECPICRQYIVRVVRFFRA